MGRASRRGDASYWLRNRRKFHDSVDAMCRAANERKDVMDSWWLAAVLKDMKKETYDQAVEVADVQPDGTILLHITRPYKIDGYYEVRIRVVDDE